jgi:hypothetical protein
MNTANLQLEGLLLAVSALLETMVRKEMLTREEVEHALNRAEANASTDPLRPRELSGANVDAICFPIRFLRLAAGATADGLPQSFAEITTRVGQTKPDH